MEALQTEYNTVSISADAVVPSDNTTIMNVGGEYAFKQIFFLRGGYQSLLREDHEEGLSFGLGVKYFVPGLSEIQVDYSFMDFGIIDDIHTIGFGVSF
jgi:hypothetical protein